MSNFRSFRLITILGVLLVSSLPSKTWAAGPDDDKEAKQKFEALEKRLKNELPGIVEKSKWFQLRNGGIKPDVEIEVMRRTGPTEAKITITYKTPFTMAIFTIYLKYFDGTWTTMPTNLEGSWPDITDDGFKGGGERFKACAHLLMLEIDKISVK